ncbi:MAG TPA: hypothetical protein VGY32_09675 [Solirubrobacteraceae bacterium]|nr:hypothetical protein [Solirubrobacteraceae bacterium]
MNAPCPQWCTTDHDNDSTCRKDVEPVKVRNGTPYRVRAYPLRMYRGTSQVAVSTGPAALFSADHDEAMDIAGLLDVLATATPAQIRRLAIQIREAADLAFPEAGS